MRKTNGKRFYTVEMKISATVGAQCRSYSRQSIQIQNDQIREIDFQQIIGYSRHRRSEPAGRAKETLRVWRREGEKPKMERSHIIQNRQSGRLWK
jgi:hypothetical protein